MHVAYQRFWLPKSGNTEDEYEDAFWPDEEMDADLNRFRASIADGATETSFAKLWANQLTRAYGEGAFANGWNDTLHALSEEWRKYVQTVPLPWYAEEKARSGAFSSLLGLKIQANGDQDTVSGQWKAVAIGDSCLFQVRRETLITAFPLEFSEQFNSRPILLSSLLPKEDWQKASARREGKWQADDAFYLMTDALACWFLQEYEQGAHPWAILRDLNTADAPASFFDLIAKLRAERRLRNDDVTLLRIDLY